MSSKPKYNSGVLALIPARSGSKSIKDKNILPFAGEPLLGHSIRQALMCPHISRVIVSTDSKKYAKLANQYGAETPFLRPSSISLDHSTDYEVFNLIICLLNFNFNVIMRFSTMPLDGSLKMKDLFLYSACTCDPLTQFARLHKFQGLFCF